MNPVPKSKAWVWTDRQLVVHWLVIDLLELSPPNCNGTFRDNENFGFWIFFRPGSAGTRYLQFNLTFRESGDVLLRSLVEDFEYRLVAAREDYPEPKECGRVMAECLLASLRLSGYFGAKHNWAEEGF